MANTSFTVLCLHDNKVTKLVHFFFNVKIKNTETFILWYQNEKSTKYFNKICATLKQTNSHIINEFKTHYFSIEYMYSITERECHVKVVNL